MSLENKLIVLGALCVAIAIFVLFAKRGTNRSRPLSKSQPIRKQIGARTPNDMEQADLDYAFEVTGQQEERRLSRKQKERRARTKIRSRY